MDRGDVEFDAGRIVSPPVTYSGSSAGTRASVWSRSNRRARNLRADLAVQHIERRALVPRPTNSAPRGVAPDGRRDRVLPEEGLARGRERTDHPVAVGGREQRGRAPWCDSRLALALEQNDLGERRRSRTPPTPAIRADDQHVAPLHPLSPLPCDTLGPGYHSRRRSRRRFQDHKEEPQRAAWLCRRPPGSATVVAASGSRHDRPSCAARSRRWRFCVHVARRCRRPAAHVASPIFRMPGSVPVRRSTDEHVPDRCRGGVPDPGSVIGRRTTPATVMSAIWWARPRCRSSWIPRTCARSSRLIRNPPPAHRRYEGECGEVHGDGDLPISASHGA